jgi:hypothetical protein
MAPFLNDNWDQISQLEGCMEVTLFMRFSGHVGHAVSHVDAEDEGLLSHRQLLHRECTRNRQPGTRSSAWD